MRALRPFALMVGLTACPRSPAPPPRPAVRDVPVVREPVDVPPPRLERGLVATLMACSPARRVDGGREWTLSLRLLIQNQAEVALPIRVRRLWVQVDERHDGTIEGPGSYEGPTEVQPRGRVEVILRPRFEPTDDPPVTVTFSFDSVGGISRPISFPIPSAVTP